MAKLNIQSLFKDYGTVKVLKDINIDIKNGEFVVLVGPSGCGKSTLLRTIAGLEDTTSGNIFIDDTLVNKIDSSERGVAMVFQSYALYPHMNVYQNMSFGLKMLKMPRAEIDERVTQAAGILKIEHLLKRKPKELSGGQRQRVAIGRAIVREPKIFLFDEPLSNLDAELRVQMRIELIKLHNRLKSTMIYVTHDQIEAMTMATKIVVLKDGVVEQVGTPDDVYLKPKNLFVANFIGSPKMNGFNGEIHKQGIGVTEVRFEDKSLPPLKVKKTAMPNMAKLKVGSRLTLGVRPQHLHLKKGKNSEEMKLTIVISEVLGSTTHLHCKSHALDEIVIEVQGNPQLKNNQSIKAYFSQKDAYWFDKNGQRL